jgi:hypothetical protein
MKGYVHIVAIIVIAVIVVLLLLHAGPWHVATPTVTATPL